MIRFFFFSLGLCLVLQVKKLMVVKNTVVACRLSGLKIYILELNVVI